MFLATNSLIIVFMSFSTTSTNPFIFFSNNRLHFCNQYQQPLILFLNSTIFMLSLQLLSTSHHSTHFFSATSPSTKFFDSYSAISFFLVPLPPLFFWIRCAVCQPPILEGSYVEDSFIPSSQYCIHDIYHLLYIRSLLV